MSYSPQHQAFPATEPQPKQVHARMNGPFSMPETRIAILYVVLASFWIISSDTLLNRLVGDLEGNVFYQTFKGLNFVATTGLLLFLVLRRAFGGWRKSEELRMAAMRASGERLRGLSSRIQKLREEERTRISREIHDELGQHLTGIKMQLRLIEDRLCDRDDRALNPAIDGLVEASTLIDETLGAVRRISSGLRPPALDHLGLAAALEEEAGQFSRRTGIECHLVMDGMERPIPDHLEIAAFRIFQESLTNVARHSQAGRIDAECSARGEVLELSVRDDGVGFDPAVLSNATSLGLVGMYERAVDCGGRIEFDSAPGNGTRVVLTLPLDANLSHHPLSA